MTTTHRISALAAVLLTAAPLLAQGPHAACIDGALPPPCAADGACFPKRQTWGYYETRWSRWPGDTEEAPTPADERSALPPAEIPEPEVEDREAPAPTTEPTTPGPAPGPAPEQQPQQQPSEGPGGLDLPPLPGLPGIPSPSDQAPTDGPGEGPNGGEDGAPPLPDFRGLTPPGIGPPPPTGPPGQGAQPSSRGADRPPALPPSLADATPVAPDARPGARVVKRLPLPPGTAQAAVQPTRFSLPLR